MLFIRTNETTAARRRIPVFLKDSTDKVTPKTGVTIGAGDLKISKAGAAEANAAGTWTELGGGLYVYEATAAECDTDGFLSVRINKSGSIIGEPAIAAVTSGVPADGRLINGASLASNSADLYLRSLNVVNPNGHGIYGESTLAGYSGIYGLGEGAGVGIKGKGGDGTPGVPATAAPGMEGEGGNAFRAGVDTDTGQEWGGPGIRGLAAGRGTPGITGKGKDGGPALLLFTDGTGPMNSPAIKIITTGLGAVDVDLGAAGLALLRLLNGSASGVRGLDARAIANLAAVFDPAPDVGDVQNVTGDVQGNIDALYARDIPCVSATATTITFPALDGLGEDNTKSGLMIQQSSGAGDGQSAMVTASTNDAGNMVMTIKTASPTGAWWVIPDPGDTFVLRLTANPLIVSPEQITDAVASGADPLANAVPGDYADGTAGAAMGRLASASVQTVGPLSPDGQTIRIVRGDSYLATDGRALTFTKAAGASWPSNISGWTPSLVITRQGSTALSVSGTVAQATGASQAVRFELTAAQTSTLFAGSSTFRVTVASGSSLITIVAGEAFIEKPT